MFKSFKKISCLTWLGLVLAVLGFFISSGGVWYLFNYSTVQAVTIDTNSVLASSSASLKNNYIMVDVSGAVIEPGIYKLPQESRVADAIQAAQGLAKSASDDYVSTQLNLSLKLDDEQKIHLPTATEWQASNSEIITQSNSSSSNLISINQASQSELESLEGVGEKRATEIIQNRPFTKLNELLDKGILSESVFEKNKSHLQL
jgi:competence protein ComEA